MKGKKSASAKRDKPAGSETGLKASGGKALPVRNASAIRGGAAVVPASSAAKITIKFAPEYTRSKKGSGN
jgi:predicted RecA/RadA family phage recombinase